MLALGQEIEVEDVLRHGRQQHMPDSTTKPENWLVVTCGFGSLFGDDEGDLEVVANV